MGNNENNIKFKRGDYVYFKGNNKYNACYSYVWTFFSHDGLSFYLIEHPNGLNRSNWLSKPPFEHIDGFESIPSYMLDEDVKYIQINCDMLGNTNELTLIKKSELK